MDLASIRKKAEEVGVDAETIKKAKKIDLVRAIQSKEGNTPCFATRTENCPYVLCCFMADCYAEAKKLGGSAKKAETKSKGRK